MSAWGQRETIAEGPVTSGVGGRPDLLWTRPGGLGVAEAVEQVGADRLLATIVPIGFA